MRDKRKRPAFESVNAVSVKKVKTEAKTSTPPPRSYTPPPIKDPRLKLALPLPEMDTQDDGKCHIIFISLLLKPTQFFMNYCNRLNKYVIKQSNTDTDRCQRQVKRSFHNRV